MEKEKTVPEINLQPITGSSQVRAFGYDPATQTLAIQFAKSDSHYRYTGVPADMVEQFKKAESKGKFFGANIRGKFPHKLIPAVEKAKA